MIPRRDAEAPAREGARPYTGAHLERLLALVKEGQRYRRSVGEALQLLADRVEQAVDVMLLKQRARQLLQTNHLAFALACCLSLFPQHRRELAGDQGCQQEHEQRRPVRRTKPGLLAEQPVEDNEGEGRGK